MGVGVAAHINGVYNYDETFQNIPGFPLLFVSHLRVGPQTT